MSGLPSHGNLVNLLEATLAALPDDVARRRWGRGLDYFRDRASKTAGPQTYVLVQDILDFLNDKHGLKQTASTLPLELHHAIQQLAQECERITRDEPVATFTFGIVDGGQAPQRARVQEFVNEVRKLDDAGADLAINVVFQLAGTISKPDWNGVHAGRLYPARRGMVVNAAPPDAIAGEELDRFLVNAIQEAIERTERSVKRHHLGWSTEPHRRILARLQRPHIEFVLSLMRDSAPQDVVETIGWLEATGWQARAAWGGPPRWEGNAGLAVEFAKADGRISIARDRGQWMMDIRPAGWKISVDLGIIQDTVAGRTDWSQPPPEPNPERLPQGVDWRAALPTALVWLAESADREQLLARMQLKRSRSLFPSRGRASK